MNINTVAKEIWMNSKAGFDSVIQTTKGKTTVVKIPRNKVPSNSIDNGSKKIKLDLGNINNITLRELKYRLKGELEYFID